MATAQLRPNISKNDALVVHILKQLCISVTGLSDGWYELFVYGPEPRVPNAERANVRNAACGTGLGLWCYF